MELPLDMVSISASSCRTIGKRSRKQRALQKRCEKYPVSHNAIHSVRGIGVRWYLSWKTRDEEEVTEGTEGTEGLRYQEGGVDVVLKFVTFHYELFTTREIIRNAVKGYVSTINANVKVTQNVTSINIFSVFVNILLWNNDFVRIRMNR